MGGAGGRRGGAGNVETWHSEVSYGEAFQRQRNNPLNHVHPPPPPSLPPFLPPSSPSLPDRYNMVSTDINYTGMDEVIDCCTWLVTMSLTDFATMRFCRRIICRLSQVDSICYSIVHSSGTIGVVSTTHIIESDPEAAAIGAVVLCNVSSSKSAQAKMLERACLPTIHTLVRVHSDHRAWASLNEVRRAHPTGLLASLLACSAQLTFLCLSLKALSNMCLMPAGRQAVVGGGAVSIVTRIALDEDDVSTDDGAGREQLSSWDLPSDVAEKEATNVKRVRTMVQRMCVVLVSNLCQDADTVVQTVRDGGLEALIRLASLEDPLVKRDCAFAICQMLCQEEVAELPNSRGLYIQAMGALLQMLELSNNDADTVAAGKEAEEPTSRASSLTPSSVDSRVTGGGRPTLRKSLSSSKGGEMGVVPLVVSTEDLPYDDDGDLFRPQSAPPVWRDAPVPRSGSVDASGTLGSRPISGGESSRPNTPHRETIADTESLQRIRALALEKVTVEKERKRLEEQMLDAKRRRNSALRRMETDGRKLTRLSTVDAHELRQKERQRKNRKMAVSYSALSL